MSYLISGYQPAKLFQFFEDISAVPRASFHVEQIAHFLMQFAADRGLEATQDEAFNVVIRKEGQNGGENAAPVILQGHTDMVPEKLAGCPHDFLTEGLDLEIVDGYLQAKGTTLGADDGAAVALMMTVLDDTELPCPPLECVFTANEEVGLLGAEALDKASLKSKMLINLDSEEEGIVTVSSAGGMTINLTKNLRRHSALGHLITIRISGLLGGHSGTEIDLGRINADKLMARTLYDLMEEDPYAQLVDFNGGNMDNAIPRECTATVLFHSSDSVDKAVTLLQHMHDDYHAEIRAFEPDFKFSIKQSMEISAHALNVEDSRALINLILLLPDGTQARNPHMDNFVVTSSNMGIVQTTENDVKVVLLPRSSVSSQMKALFNRIKLVAETFSFDVEVESSYPGWTYRENSPLRDLFLSEYQALTGEPMLVQALHAGLETGLFANAMPDLDAVSVGPTLSGVHTPDERMELASFERFYELLAAVLKKLAE